MNTERLRTYAALDQLRLEYKKKIASITAELAPLEEQIIEEIAQSGVTSMRVDGTTVYLERKIWAKCVDEDWDRAIEALKDAGLGDFIQHRYNSTSFSAYLRELDKAGKPLPEPLMGAIEPEVRLSIRTRRSA